MSIWDLIGSASYTLAFALLESLVLAVPFVLAAIFLPARLFKGHFVVLSTIIVLVSTIWMIDANYHQVNFADADFANSLPNFALYLLSLATPIALVLRSKRIDSFIHSFVQRLAVLVYVYTALACLGVLIVLVRNL